MSKRKIIEIKQQVRDPQRKTLIFDDGSVFGISEDVFLSHNFEIGSEICDKSFDDLFNEELQIKVYNSAIRLLGYRMRSCSEMRRRLIEKKYPKDMIEFTINRLLNLGYLNDAEFAEAFTHDKVRNKKIGPLALRNEFIPYNISTDIIDKSIDKIYQKYPTTELIKELLEKKKILPGESLDLKTKKHITDMLMRKGFSWNEISTVFTDLEIT